jgi:hypothetical protein
MHSLTGLIVARKGQAVRGSAGAVGAHQSPELARLGFAPEDLTQMYLLRPRSRVLVKGAVVTDDHPRSSFIHCVIPAATHRSLHAAASGVTAGAKKRSRSKGGPELAMHPTISRC